MSRRARCIPRRRSGGGAVCAALVAVAAPGAPATAQTDSFLLIDRTLQVRPVRVIEINERALVYRDENDQIQTPSLDESIALMNARTVGDASLLAPQPEPAPFPAGASAGGPPGLLVLSDGQRLPGTLVEQSGRGAGTIAWRHEWLGRIEVPLDHVAAVTFRPHEPIPTADNGEVVVLRNGDRLEGYVTSVGDPIRIDAHLDGAETRLEIPLGRAAAVALVSAPRAPAGRRIWFRDGSMIDSEQFRVGDDGYIRLSTEWTRQDALPTQVQLADIDAILFDARRMVPLGTLAPSAISSTFPRYVLPPPRALEDDAPLGLTRIEYRGPLVVRYTLPAGARRFAASAELPEAARQWGDLELVIRDDDTVVHRRRLNAEHPADTVNVALHGSELTIELECGANGPIQDRVVLSRAMVLVER